jgi:hypothetical protein
VEAVDQAALGPTSGSCFAKLHDQQIHGSHGDEWSLGYPVLLDKDPISQGGQHHDHLSTVVGGMEWFGCGFA